MVALLKISALSPPRVRHDVSPSNHDLALIVMVACRYGDLTPRGDGMRLFTVVFAICAVGIVGPAVGVLLDT